MVDGSAGRGSELLDPCSTDGTKSNSITQYGPNLWVQYIVETKVPVNICTVRVEAEGNVGGVGNSALHSVGYPTASAKKQVPVPWAGKWTSNGAHWYTLTADPATAIFAGYTQATTDVAQQQAYDPAAECAARGWDYSWNGFECVYNPGSPIVIDTGGKGYKLTSVADGVWFDLTGDGASEQVAWTARGAENAFLAIDRNGNGRIDDGTELFGTATPVMNGTATAGNGFEALAFYAFSETDVVSAVDPVFSQLLFWTDRNHNGVSEPEELQSVLSSGVGALPLRYKTVGRKDHDGNTYRQVGTVTWANGKQDNIYDIWFAFDR